MSAHKHRRRTEICHNCGTILPPDTNFCPSCGQENHDLKVPIGHLIYEVAESITHFDTKLWNTVKAICTKPGKITKDFLEGRRARYVPPVRLYIFVAFIFFLVLNKYADASVANLLHKDKETALKNAGKEKDKKDSEKAGMIIASRLNEKLSENAGKENSRADSNDNFDAGEFLQNFNEDDEIGDILDELNIAKKDTLRKILGKLPLDVQKAKLISFQKQIAVNEEATVEIEQVTPELRAFFTEKFGKRNALQYTINLKALKDNKEVQYNFGGDTTVTVRGSKGDVENVARYKAILEMSNEELDTYMKTTKILGIESYNLFGKWYSRQFYRNRIKYTLAFHENKEEAIHNVVHLLIGIFSLMMFFLMPLVAGLLKLIYSQRTHWAVRHPFQALFLIIKKILVFFKVLKPDVIKHIPSLHNRKDWYYYEHLIFSIHSHSVFFLMIPLFWTIVSIFHLELSLTGPALLFGYLYLIISLKTVYRQKWLKTVVKSLILVNLYFFLFFFVALFVGIVKFGLS